MQDYCNMQLRLLDARTDAERKAWESLARYKFWMAGYHIAHWVKLNRLMNKDDRQPNPFSELVHMARDKVKEQWG